MRFTGVARTKIETQITSNGKQSMFWIIWHIFVPNKFFHETFSFFSKSDSKFWIFYDFGNFDLSNQKFQK